MRIFSLQRKLSKALSGILILLVFGFFAVKPAWAATPDEKAVQAAAEAAVQSACSRCIGKNQACLFPDCQAEITQFIMTPLHWSLREIMILTVFRENFNDYREWFATKFFDDNVSKGLNEIADVMSTVAMQQAFILGTMFDAKQQMEVQRTFQELQNEAHRDYQPSEDFCWFGTNVRGMAASESRGRYQSLALGAVSLERQLGTAGTAGAAGRREDKAARWAKFKTTYCDPQDNNWNGQPGSGLMLACGEDGGGDSERINIDIDYTRLIDSKRTLDMAFDNVPGIETSPGQFSPPADREDVIALQSNLYGHDVLTRNIVARDMANLDYQTLYLALRSVAARRNVAENSFNAIVEMKSSGGIDEATGSSARDFLGAILTELGVPPDEVAGYIGENPSYYAQLEILAKKLYQSPDFYANLYDSPANIARKSVALKAIELMLDRAIYESELRQEMVSSVLLSTDMVDEAKKADSVMGRPETGGGG